MLTHWLAALIALPPVLNILVKLTLILALGWMLHFALLRANPRWRVLLWRAVALGVIAVPLIALALPIIRISLPRPAPVLSPAVPAPVEPEPASLPAPDL